MDEPVDTCNVFYEVPIGGESVLIDGLNDEVDILYEQEESDEQA